MNYVIAFDYNDNKIKSTYFSNKGLTYDIEKATKNTDYISTQKMYNEIQIVQRSPYLREKDKLGKLLGDLTGRKISVIEVSDDTKISKELNFAII